MNPAAARPARRRIPVTRPAGLLLLLAVLAGVGCDLRRERQITGRTMGTTWQVKFLAGPLFRTAPLKEAVVRRLEEINASMSAYRADSELSRFNTLDRTGEKIAVGGDFTRVLALCARLHRLTGGAWDGTVMPLVRRWGFGPDGPRRPLPEPGEIAALQERVGFDHVLIQPPGTVAKGHPQVALDLGSVAKGYGVDQVAVLMVERGLADFLVEIGGEVRAAGRRPDGHPWRVGVNTPRAGGDRNRVHVALDLDGGALATSGDYRNFFEIDGRRFSHVIDPRSGFPVDNGVASVSVLAPDCALADGLATGLMVMGAEEGLALVARMPGVECLFVLRGPDGRIRDRASPGFPAR